MHAQSFFHRDGFGQVQFGDEGSDLYLLGIEFEARLRLLTTVATSLSVFYS
jgi:hypothetical protein